MARISLTDNSIRHSRWLLPVLLVLFIMVMATIPAVLGVTYSGRSEDPDHTLSYIAGELYWDYHTDLTLDANGVALLNVFDAEYDNVKSEDGRDVVAPGTAGHTIVRLKNTEYGEIEYTAVLYRIRSDENLAVEPSFLPSDRYDPLVIKNNRLPKGVTEDQVIDVVTGIVSGTERHDFDLVWQWAFHEDAQQDAADTALGIAAQTDPDEVTVGLFIIVTDRTNSFPGHPDTGTEIVVTPSPDLPPPKTGDRGPVAAYTTLLVIGALVLLIAIIDQLRLRRQEKKQCGE